MTGNATESISMQQNSDMNDPTGRHTDHKAFLITACLVAQFALGGLALADSFDRDGVFGETGKEFNSLRALPKWPDVLERYQAEQQQAQQCRKSGQGRCGYAPWQRIVSELRGQEKATQIREINRFVNRRPYITDPTNWGSEDHWATPDEFFEKAGDCEDFAIAKFLGLRALGFDNDQLRLVAVEDRKRGVNHTVTLVQLDGEVLLLDNELNDVRPADTVRHYKPVFAANEESWWLFK
ncbi:MAG: hypothetical protein GVY22_19280 [Gammaproteobacteria bacterium]|jgi:predicted transglutaminase-like cysteine proteinase|nr:hypothetical protein [Gammaproteobacteria bacterium]